MIIISNHNSWKSEDRYFSVCPMCKNEFPMRHMISISVTPPKIKYGSKILTKLCKECYKKFLNYLKKYKEEI